MLLKRNIVFIVWITVPKSNKNFNIGSKDALLIEYIVIINGKKWIKILLFICINVEDNWLYLLKKWSKRFKNKIGRWLNHLNYYLNDLSYKIVLMDSIYLVYEKS